MFEYNYEYDVCNIFDRDVFVKQCNAIESHVPYIIKKELLHDVDGSEIQIYQTSNTEKIKVVNDACLGITVYSSMPLESYFN